METIKKISKKVFDKLSFVLNRIKYSFIKPSYPINQDNKILIHLGCGDINSPEFINVDSRFFPHIHHIHNVEKLYMFPDNFADLIYASHTLEHISMLNVENVLSEWRRVLKPRGILRLSVPDFDKIINIYFDNGRKIESIWMPLLGSQEYKENSHYSVFNHSFLSALLKKLEFKEVRVWDPKKVKYHNFEDWASREISISDKFYPISQNIEAIK